MGSSLPKEERETKQNKKTPLCWTKYLTEGTSFFLVPKNQVHVSSIRCHARQLWPTDIFHCLFHKLLKMVEELYKNKVCGTSRRWNISEYDDKMQSEPFKELCILNIVREKILWAKKTYCQQYYLLGLSDCLHKFL